MTLVSIGLVVAVVVVMDPKNPHTSGVGGIGTPSGGSGPYVVLVVVVN